MAREQHEKCKSAGAAARRFARGAAGVPDSVDQWPGVETAGRPARALPVAEPQAEVCGDAGYAVTSFAARFGCAPAAPPGAVAPLTQEHPSRVAQILSGGTLPAVASRFPLCAIGMSPSELGHALPYVALP